MDKINVLCLHGCCQTAEMFRSLMRSLVKKGKNIQFHFLHGPFEHPDGGATWTDPPLLVENIWHDGDILSSRENILSAVPGIEYDDEILSETFSMIREYIQQNNIIILLGFSQGSFVCYEYMRKFRDVNIKKIVAMSGYTFDRMINPPLDVDILNISHPMDNVVPMRLAYSNGSRTTTLTHNNKALTEPSREGHKCPTKSSHMRDISNFISSIPT